MFSHTVTASSSHGALTHFWITTAHSDDRTTVRYYIDDESSPSIEYDPSLAAGVGFHDNSVWGLRQAGHASDIGGWYNNFRVPFSKSLRDAVARKSTCGAEE